MAAVSTACLIVLLCLSHFVMVSSKGAIVITPMPDGISVQGTETLRQMVEAWDVFVTLEAPPYPTELARQVESLDDIITTLGALEIKFQEYHFDPHRMRAQRMRHVLGLGPTYMQLGRTPDWDAMWKGTWTGYGNQSLPTNGTDSNTTPRPRRRHRRGWMNFGGDILNVVFGVATTAQLGRYHHTVAALSDRQDNLAHSQAHLASIVNQTKTYMDSLAMKTATLQHHAVRVGKAIAQLTYAIDDYKYLQMTTRMDNYLDVLDISVNLYAEQKARFTRQRQALERGFLTRDLLEEEHLKSILEQAADSHQVVDTLSWYYQYLRVNPLWRKGRNLLYVVELPLIAYRPYLMYKITSHPVPLGNSSYAVALDLGRSYALDTITGNLFLPRNCLGKSPTICNTGPEFGPEVLKCPRGLITGRKDLMAHCKVNIVPLHNQPLVTTMALNQFAIATMGESLTVRCPGTAESHYQLPLGTHNITCLRACSISGSGFLIKCVNRKFLERSYIMPTVRVTKAFNFSRILNYTSLRRALPGLDTPDFQPPTGLDVNWLMSPLEPVRLPHVGFRPSILGIINGIIVFVLFAFLIIAYLRWKFSHRHLLPITPDLMTEDVSLTEALPLAEQPHNPTSATLSRPPQHTSATLDRSLAPMAVTAPVTSTSALNAAIWPVIQPPTTTTQPL